MFVYGDPTRRIDCQAWLQKLREPPAQSSPLARHAEHVARLIEGGQIAQAIADAAFHEAGGRDLDNDEVRAILRIVLALARNVAVSWTSGFRAPAQAIAQDVQLALPPFVTAREPEGYAYYALYPEAFFEAARASLPKTGPTFVIGLRSIGTSLGAMVAAGAAAPSFATVRPKGHPFHREICASDLMHHIARERNASVAIVDEGPGLSGSSFAAVMEHLREAGVAERALSLFPSHSGMPGGEASDTTHAAFNSVSRHVVSFEDLVIHTPVKAHRLESWVEDLTGPAMRPLADIAGGQWREFRGDPPETWPACDLQQERRKYILESERGRFLLKFVGLGAAGQRKAALAQRLSDEGLTPPFLGLRHGYSVERWIDAPSATPGTRGGLLTFIARYLAYRAKHFAQESAAGADLSELREMALQNTREALGSRAGDRMAHELAHLPHMQSDCRRIATDNRMHPHEWLCTGHGGYLKTDAIDHHAGHDLVGAQDVAWDIAGAITAFNLDATESEALCRAVERVSGASVSRALVSGLKLCQCAFETGRLTMVAQANASSPEHSRLSFAAARQVQQLARLLD